MLAYVSIERAWTCADGRQRPTETGHSGKRKDGEFYSMYKFGITLSKMEYLYRLGLTCLFRIRRRIDHICHMRNNWPGGQLWGGIKAGSACWKRPVVNLPLFMLFMRALRCMTLATLPLSRRALSGLPLSYLMVCIYPLDALCSV